jgi:hypothetical protein
MVYFKAERGRASLTVTGLHFKTYIRVGENRDSSVSIVTGYGLDDRMIRVRFPAGAGNLSFRHHVQIGSGAHPSSYPMGSFPGGKAGGHEAND